VPCNSIVSNLATGHGREGINFGENGEHTFYDVSKAIGEALIEAQRRRILVSGLLKRSSRKSQTILREDKRIKETHSASNEQIVLDKYFGA